MTDRVISIDADATLPAAAKIMHDKKIHRLPVVDKNHHPIGIITQSDIVRAIAS